MVQGLSHITLVVENLDKTESMLRDILDAKKIYDSGDIQFSLSAERFFDISGIWVVIMQGEALPKRNYNHIAFQIDESELEIRRERIERLGLELRESRPRIHGEGQSIYFYDYDNHLFELHSGSLTSRLESYKANQPVHN